MEPTTSDIHEVLERIDAITLELATNSPGPAFLDTAEVGVRQRELRELNQQVSDYISNLPDKPNIVHRLWDLHFYGQMPTWLSRMLAWLPLLIAAIGTTATAIVGVYLAATTLSSIFSSLGDLLALVLSWW